VMNDETGGKPLTGYGSGTNGDDSPVATPEQSAAMLIAGANKLVADGRRMCLNGGGFAFDGTFCQSLITTSLGLRRDANRFAGSGQWSSGARQLLTASNAAFLMGAAGCGVLALATAGTGGVACAAIYSGAALTSAASTAVTFGDLARGKADALGRASLFATAANVTCMLALKGDARRACVAIVGTIGGILAGASVAEDMRRAREHRLRTMSR